MRSDIDVIAKGIALQAQLVDDLLDITRITGGKLRLDLRPIDAHAALRHAHNILRSDIQSREIEVTLDLAAPGTPSRPMPCVCSRFFGTCSRTPSNSLRAAAGDRPHPQPGRESDTLEVEIIDTGVGIEPEMIGKSSTPSSRKIQSRAPFRRHRPRSGHHATAGRTAKRQITRESEGRGKGATFCIELPLEQDAPLAGQTPPPTAGCRERKPRHILLVEDHEQTRVDPATLLDSARPSRSRRRDHRGAARERAGTGDFDLIISDLGLPDGDGHKLMSEIHDTMGCRGLR